MSPKEKAKELVEKFTATTHPISVIMVDGKKCALIAVDEILKVYPKHRYTRIDDFGLQEIREISNEEYWQSVKDEIEKL